MSFGGGLIFLPRDSYSATQMQDTTVVILANQVDGDHGGMGLVRVGKGGGQVVTRLPFKDRTPHYVLDNDRRQIIVWQEAVS